VDLREVVSLAPLLVFMVIIGVYPTFILNLINGSITLLLSRLQ
jgi:NADH:ubiquinone oxidoreductase subunit 4 (subunit M)